LSFNAIWWLIAVSGVAIGVGVFVNLRRHGKSQRQQQKH
jgi:cbb3-type cytochrome oxidase subunit 3